MALMQIKIYGDSVLRQKAEPIGEISSDLKELAESMGETMYAANGIGLAAPQVGVSRRLVVVDVDWASRDKDESGARSLSEKARNLRVYVNPEITWESDEDCSLDEGCLSLPGVEGEVYRPSSVKVRYRDLQGVEHEELMEDMLGRCIQHEIDHLDGILFPDRMPFIKRARIAGQLNRLKHKQATIAD